MLLVKYAENYADEFDVYGWKVLSVDEWDSLCVESRKNIDENPYFERYFGTNECMEWANYESWRRNFTVAEISGEEVAVLSRLFPGLEFGRFLTPEL